MPAIDYSLYLVTDPHMVDPCDLPRVVQRAIRGGVSVVQYRNKEASTEVFTAEARALQSAIDVPLYINDRLEVAQALGCHLHIGQHDITYPEARAALDPGLKIGLTIENYEQMASCIEQCTRANIPLPDVVGLGPVQDTATKPDAAPAIGVDGVARIATLAKEHGVHSVAIGGVNAVNAASLSATEVSGLCVISAILTADDPEAAARELRDVYEEHHV